jgi:hypothetical protein
MKIPRKVYNNSKKNKKINFEEINSLREQQISI